jgi:acetyltransferase-like isoleucine patch superfamily enzyme
MTTDVIEMTASRRLHGTFSLEKAGHPAGFYNTRKTFLDFRGPLSIHPSTGWGWYAVVITTSHDTISGETIHGENMTGVVEKPVTIDEGAYIGSYAILYNCHIQHHAIVACGAVVRNMTVPPYTIVEGNPARIVKEYRDGKWIPVERKDDVGIL